MERNEKKSHLSRSITKQTVQILCSSFYSARKPFHVIGFSHYIYTLAIPLGWVINHAKKLEARKHNGRAKIGYPVKQTCLYEGSINIMALLATTREVRSLI